MTLAPIGAAVAMLALAGAEANAQQPRPASRRLNALSVEIEGVGGYTLVDVNSWARPGVVLDRNRNLSGFAGRLFFANAGNSRIAIEVGRQQLFWYRAQSQDGLTQDSVDIEPWYGGFAMRLHEAKRFTFDFGMGMYKLPKSILAFRDNGLRVTTNFAVHYRLVSYRGMSLPIGARISSIVDNRAAVLPAALTAGVEIRPFRGARGR